MHHLGNFALMAIFVMAAYAVVASLLGARKRNARLLASGERALLATTALSTTACLALVTLLLRSDFRYEYVASYSNRDLPFAYKLASLWAGNDGSLLFWSWLLLLFSGITILSNRNKNRELMPYVVATLGVVILFFTYVNFWMCNPFEQLGVMTQGGGTRPWAPADGRGLNPLLQHPIMAIHPPILYTGYVGFVIPFAFAIAALATGRLGADWITSTRRWTLFAWFFLGIGIILGGRWAYVELGWGGYWAWDPVENAAFMPWLTGTAYLHSVMIQERKGMLKVWNVALVVITYLLCIFGTFLTRSGVVASVHAFAESDFAQVFLIFIAIAAVASAALIIYRLPALKSENELDSMISRESGFLFNNLLFVLACFAVLFGTLYPVLSEAIQGEKTAVTAPWFNQVNIPIGLALLALTGIGPLLAWRKSSLDSLRRNFTWPLVAGLATTVVLVAFGVRHAYALICFGLSAFVIATIVQEFHKGAKARRAHRGGSYPAALLDLTLVNTRRYGGYIVHLGMVFIFIGVAGSAFDVDKKADLKKGESLSVRGYQVKLLGIDEGRTPNYEWLAANLEVSKNGKLVGTFAPQKHLYLASQQPTSEVRRHSTFHEDLYLVFASVTEDDKATVQAFVKPLVRWVWIGGIVIFLGTIVIMVPAKRELKLARKAVSSRESEAQAERQRKKKYEVA
jgi:cytochrome c-type biogenesis protein CcmF